MGFFDLNVSVAVYTESTAEQCGEFDYTELIGELSPAERVEAKVLKLLLQRYGCYGSYNR
ncbi:hypothetical protein DRJ48_01010 [Candidatus Woesearchaeota archaeon]|nr:MAG: hypothetical protein DRJ48_01010 [Candidatus Woesearchaeota archaeon]